jgi:hypothetical protein
MYFYSSLDTDMVESSGFLCTYCIKGLSEENLWTENNEKENIFCPCTVGLINLKKRTVFSFKQ